MENIHIIAADVQEGMLTKVRNKIKGTELEKKISLLKCKEDSINLSEKVDFILAFYMIHEVKDKYSLFLELKKFLNPEGQLLIIEPWFHVNKKAFTLMKTELLSIGFEILAQPKVFFSRSILVELKD